MPDLAEALERIAGTAQLLVALDFDGTLAPLVDVPDDARALPAARSAVLRLLGLPRTRVALISGRAIDSLMHVSALPDTALLIGSHGVETRLDAAPALTLDASELDKMGHLRRSLDSAIAGLDGVWVERKPAGFAVHTRLADSAVTVMAQSRALKAADALGGVTTRRGNNVLEFSVRATTKGDAIRSLRKFSEATAVLFAGDDVTDEDGFTELGRDDVGLKCGSGETAAEFSVAGIEQVADALQILANFRETEIGA